MPTVIIAGPEFSVGLAIPVTLAALAVLAALAALVVHYVLLFVGGDGRFTFQTGRTVIIRSWSRSSAPAKARQNSKLDYLLMLVARQKEGCKTETKWLLGFKVLESSWNSDGGQPGEMGSW
jgi:hypothetical protein